MEYEILSDDELAEITAPLRIVVLASLSAILQHPNLQAAAM
ncbi:hypothetical protein C4K22_3615 [Pseudomonas chlororaphis subsp. aurantiaca]|nr:hypothetical protein [Pseudomonas chlororaphis]AZD22751.1 hypothetical protein C4K24_3449 [Pseudomonas chlororaphis subsp. aurantiaca]AZD36357.1 hypothetical protein C4K22_3615 [Pseudomonas chlororaphis subsp. aurantiaca]AZD42696.1 hypothetical protein C4K21_3623 [Pseudomonas chlororaphis subsp. aurantiaca]